VYVIFDEPVELSMLRIWNYSKTPSRGVRDVAVCIFDVISYVVGFIFYLHQRGYAVCHSISLSRITAKLIGQFH